MICPNCGTSLENAARFCGMCGAAFERLVDKNLGRTIANRYVLRERIGGGSLGIVYRADPVGLGRRVAVKLLAPDRARDPRSIERFRQEGVLLVRLKSAHTVTVYEVDHEPDGGLYIVMELSEGRALADVLRTEAPLAWWRVLKILYGLCESLTEAHELGIVHRDLKPENILLEDRASNHDFVKLTDFGLAKLLPVASNLSPAGQTIGSLEYNAPEQLLQRPVDARTDIYALGVLGYRAVTAKHPLHEARGPADLVAAHLRVVPPPASTLRPGIPADVDAILARCLEKDPARRFQDAESLAALIRVAAAALLPEGGATVQTPAGFMLEGDDDDPTNAR